MALHEANLGLSWEAFAVNVYKRWEHRVYAGTRAARANALCRRRWKTVRHTDTNLYANHDGNVYKASPGSGWKIMHTSQGWSPLANEGMRSVLHE